MIFCHYNNLFLGQKSHRWFIVSSSASLEPTLRNAKEGNAISLCFEGTKERVRKMFDKVDLSVSSYDTAWVAMVPSPKSHQDPCFPECLNWVLDNQLHDGSWGLSHRHPLLIKDTLSSTLACILALKKWGVGEEQLHKGLDFIESNFHAANDENQQTPIGFNILFPSMLEYAKDYNLNLRIRQDELISTLHKRDLELKKDLGSNSEEFRTYLAYLSEGIGNLQRWETVMKYQRKNGSLFNSPSTTAASLSHLPNSGCLNYLHSILKKYGNAVPTVYPLDIYARLCMVDSLERLGIDKYFKEEIRSVLDETYRYWLQEEEDIFLDITTCAMAFRLLRLTGYDVSSEPLLQIFEDHFSDSPEGHLKNTGVALELYKASQIIIHPNESALEKQKSWLTHLLKEQLSNGVMQADRFNRVISQEVDDALKFPFCANLDRLENRRYIEHYNVDCTRILKTSYRSKNLGNEDFLNLAVEDFNLCQSIHREELKQLERWVVENRLDKLKFARQKLHYCYFSAAAALFSPELSEARITWAKNSLLTTVVDDFFDIGGSKDELVNLMQLLEKWEVNVGSDCCSEHVDIIFSAVRNTIIVVGETAYRWQTRNVTNHLIEIWLDLLKSMFLEAEWVRNKSVPTLDEYMANGYVSFALGPIVLSTLYFIGPKLSEDIVGSCEYNKLFKLMSSCGRLLNDIQGFEREAKEGKLNAVMLRIIERNGATTEEDVIGELKVEIEDTRRELLRSVLQRNGSVIPRDCKDLFWKMSKVLHLFYMKNDGFSSQHEMVGAVRSVIQEPIILK